MLFLPANIPSTGPFNDITAAQIERMDELYQSPNGSRRIAPAEKRRILPAAAPIEGLGDEDNNIDTPRRDSQTNSADTRYHQLKARLNEAYAHMFELKAELDAMQSAQTAKWEEYHLLRQAYERQLKRIIADWVMNQHLSI
ncbi:MAG: hypothetical protein FWH03_07030 [Firmicutes bacterium]|nr:hypothetical protein [Bacillota bacterium]